MTEYGAQAWFDNKIKQMWHNGHSTEFIVEQLIPEAWRIDEFEGLNWEDTFEVIKEYANNIIKPLEDQV